jgi:hypothetical protein
LSASVNVPVWLAVLIAAFAGIALLDRIFRPLTGWFLEWRLNRVIDRADRHLKVHVLALMGALEAKDAHVYVPRADQDYAVDVGLRMLTLRNVVDERDGLFAVRDGERALLAYYANSIAHLAEGPGA